MKFKLFKKDEKLIDELAKTDAVRELARVFLAYLTVEELAQFIASFILVKAKGGDESDAVNYFLKDQFLSLLKTFTLSMADFLPDMITDVDFMRMVAKLYGDRFSIKNLFR